MQCRVWQLLENLRLHCLVLLPQFAASSRTCVGGWEPVLFVLFDDELFLGSNKKAEERR